MGKVSAGAPAGRPAVTNVVVTHHPADRRRELVVSREGVTHLRYQVLKSEPG